MKRFVIFGAIALSAGLAFGAITEDEAVSIALSNAGITHEDAHIRVRRDYDDGRMEYEIEIHAPFGEWEYTIDADSGRITDAEADVRRGRSSFLDRRSLEDIALSDANLSRDAVSGIRCEYDGDDGFEYAEVSFSEGNGRYEYKLMPDGTILSSEWEIRRGPWGRSNARLTEEEAESIALEVIGGSADRIIVWEDRDDGRFIYEGEAIKGDYRYEVEIDGSGELLSMSRHSRRW